MELQAQIKAFEAAGAALYSLSYDEPDALADFRDAYDITYGLLADPDSHVIRQFGILNTLVGEDDHPWFGVPFPGTYVVSAAGVISQKFFGKNFALRTGPEILLRALREESGGRESPARERQVDANWNVFLDGERLIVSVLRDLVARIELPVGERFDAQQTLAGKDSFDLLLKEHPRLVVGDVDVVHVNDGEVELRVPLAVNANLADGAIYAQEDITISGELRWHGSGSDVAPRCEKFELTLPVGPALRSELTTPVDGTVVRAMNGMQHFQKMAARRGITDLSKLFPE